MHVFNTSTQEAEAGGFLGSRPDWSTKWVPGHPGLYRETPVSKKTHPTKKNKNKPKPTKQKTKTEKDCFQYKSSSQPIFTVDLVSTTKACWTVPLLPWRWQETHASSIREWLPVQRTFLHCHHCSTQMNPYSFAGLPTFLLGLGTSTEMSLNCEAETGEKVYCKRTSCSSGGTKFHAQHPQPSNSQLPTTPAA